MQIKNLALRSVIAVPIGFIAIGGVSLLAPEIAALGYGISPPFGDGKAYFYAAGVRDIFIGILLLQTLLKSSQKDASLALMLSAIIPLADGISVLHYEGLNLLYGMIHFGGACAIFSLGAMLKFTQEKRIS